MPPSSYLLLFQFIRVSIFQNFLIWTRFSTLLNEMILSRPVHYRRQGRSGSLRLQNVDWTLYLF